MHKIGNLRALASTLVALAERDGNEAEHQLGIELVELARREGMTDDQIIDALTHGKTYVRVESAMAKRHNEEVADIPGCIQRPEAWEGYIPEVESLEGIFRFFNRVEPGDDERLFEIGYTLPSLSVGDVVEWRGKRRRVEPVGWVEIHEPSRLVYTVHVCPECRKQVSPLPLSPNGFNWRCDDHGCFEHVPTVLLDAPEEVS